MTAPAAAHIIDDDEAVRDSLAVLLEASGMPTVTYASARAFLHRLTPAMAGCIVTDVQMPDMSGLELLRSLKLRACPMPVIVVSGRGGLAMAEAAMQFGAAAFLHKPFEPDEVVAVVRANLAPRVPTPQG